MIYHYRHQSTEEESTESLLQLAWSGQCTRCHPLRDAYCGFLPWGVGGGLQSGIIVKVRQYRHFFLLYYYMRNFCNLIGLEQWYFSLI